jgi:hypothetical protein
MHEQEFRDISSISISASSTSATTISPPSSDSNLSPDRIIYIIVGTILVFLVGTLLISVCRTVTRKQPQVENGSLISLNEIDGGDIFMEDLSQHRPDGPRFPTSLSAVQSPFHLTLPSTRRYSSKADSHLPRSSSKSKQPSDESTKNDELQLELDEIDDNRYTNDNDNESEEDVLDSSSSHHSSYGGGAGSLNRTSKQSPSKSGSYRNNSSFLSTKKKKRVKDKIDYESLVL